VTDFINAPALAAGVDELTVTCKAHGPMRHHPARVEHPPELFGLTLNSWVRPGNWLCHGWDGEGCTASVNDYWVAGTVARGEGCTTGRRWEKTTVTEYRKDWPGEPDGVTVRVELTVYPDGHDRA